MSNKKGFTLVELLAVIVVLAIIMVIATMSVNTTIVKTRATSFVKTMDMVVKNAKEIVQLEELKENLLKERLDYSEDEYNIFVSKNSDNTYLIVLKATDKGEFNNVDLTKAEQNNSYKYEDKTICTNLSENGILSKPDSCGSNLEENDSGGNSSSKNYNVGDEISFTNKDTGKKEEFYVISDDGTTVTALAKYGLLISMDYFTFYSSRYLCYPNDLRNKVKNYGLQSDTTSIVDSCYVGFDIPFYDHYHSYYPGAIDFGYWYTGSKLDEKYGSSYPVKVYDENSSLYEPIEDYKNYFITTLNKKSAKIRLINIEDLKSLGCNIDYKTCETSGKKWLYGLSYWINVAYDEYGASSVEQNGKMVLRDYMGTSAIRPVIEINKSEI